MEWVNEKMVGEKPNRQGQGQVFFVSAWWQKYNRFKSLQAGTSLFGNAKLKEEKPKISHILKTLRANVEEALVE